MLNSYLPVFILFLLAAVVPIAMMIFSSWLGPKVRGTTKEMPYECGVTPQGAVRGQVSVKFYRVAVLFLLFDVEIAFLFPWAILFQDKLSEWGFAFLALELFLFLIILMVGYIFAWKKGALEWD